MWGGEASDENLIIKHKRAVINDQPWGAEGWAVPQQGQQSWGQEAWGQQNAWGQQGQSGGGWGNSVDWPNTDQMWGNHLQGADWIEQQKKTQAFDLSSLGQQINLADVLEEQVLKIEPSAVASKLKELRAKGQKFIDDKFPANNNSLCGEYGMKGLQKFQWRKVSEVMPKADIFQGKIEPSDIKQGSLGDCYFLAGLAALAERPDRIFSLFLEQSKNQLNYYSVKMLYKGKWLTIDMDEYVPFYGNAPAFTKSVNNELWVVLLEKAWAKLYTSYKRIEAGYPEEPLHDLTGAPTRRIFIKQGGFNPETQWQYLMKASALEYSMVCSSNPGSDTNKSTSGVVQGHAYTLLQVVELNYQGQKVRLVQLRNPWGSGEYKDEWSDNDPKWNQVPEQEKRRVGYENQANDGTFFIPYSAFCNEYRSITVAQINDNASYVYKSAKDPKKNGCYFKINILKDGKYCLQIDNKPERAFEDSKQESYQYPLTNLEIASFANGAIKKMEGMRSRDRTLSKSYQLSVGTYLAMAKIDFNPAFDTECDVNLAVYAQFPCEIKIASKQEAVAMSGNPNVQWTGEDIKPAGDSWNNLAAWNYKQNPNTGDWGTGGGWGLPSQPAQQNTGGWGNPAQPVQPNTGGWGAPVQPNTGGWGNPVQPVQPNTGGWGAPVQPNTGGWGNPVQPVQPNTGGWGNPVKPSNNGWDLSSPQQQGQGGQDAWGQGSNYGYGNGWNPNQ